MLMIKPGKKYCRHVPEAATMSLQFRPTLDYWGSLGKFVVKTWRWGSIWRINVTRAQHYC